MPLTRREVVQTASLGAVLASALIAIRSTLAQVFRKITDRLVFPGGVPMPAQSLGVAACAVRRGLIALSHADTRPLVLSATIVALVVVACISPPQVSQISPKTQTAERK
jgi:hypothetical protein